MSKKKREQTVPIEAAPARARPLVPVLLLAISAAAALLALFQWMELLVVRAGGTAACKVSETLDCEKVWDTPFAAAVHSTLGVPVAGLGLIWALAAFAAALAWAYHLLGGRPGGAQAAALKLVAWAGLLSIPVLAVVGFGSGAICLACITTYVVVAAFALVVLRLVPGGAWPTASLKGGAVWAVGLTVGAWLVLLGPGLATPKSSKSGASSLVSLPSTGQPKTTPTQPVPPHSGPPLSEADQAVASFLQSLAPMDRQLVSNGLAAYNAGVTPAQSPPGARRIFGAADAPVRVVEWVDFRCGACRMLNETMRELKRVVPEGTLSVEARNYPLDSECNPSVGRTDGSSISCTAAKASICLEGTKEYWKLRDQLFSQPRLTADRVLEIASSGELNRPQLEQCLASPETSRKLREDIDYALRYDIQGTPLLVINGRETMAGAAGPLLYALSLTGGDTQSPAFRTLPPPRAMDPHHGHNHGPGDHHH